jgi:hypothetical protein
MYKRSLRYTKVLRKRRKYKLPVFLFFLEYEKTYDRVNRSKLWDILNGYRLPTDLVNAVKSIYDNTNIFFSEENKDITRPPPPVVNQGLRQVCGFPQYCSTYMYINNVLDEWQLTNS